MSNTQAFRANKGETFKLSLSMNNADGTPVDLTGHAVVLILRDRKTKQDIGEWAGAVEGNSVVIKVAATDTDAWALGKYAYRIEDRQPNGDTFWMVMGVMTVGDGTDLR